jgi:Flp pilus assembly protein TadD
MHLLSNQARHDEALVEAARSREALAAIRQARDLSGSATEPMTQLGYALAKSGDTEDARRIYLELERRAAERYVPAYSFAMISNGLGDTR